MPSVSNKDVCACGAWKGDKKHRCKACSVEYLTAKALAMKGRKRNIKEPPIGKIHPGESGYIGVYCSTKNNSWTGAIQILGKRLGIGHWDTPREAHKVRLAIYLAVYGKYPVDRLAENGEYAGAEGAENTNLERLDKFVDYLKNIA